MAFYVNSKNYNVFFMITVSIVLFNIVALHARQKYGKRKSTNYVQCDTLWKELRSVDPKEHKHMVVIIPSYNNKQWYKRNLDSVFMQTYDNFNVIYIDDASPDGTGQLVEQYIHEKNMEKKVLLIKNEKRCGALANIYKAIYLCDDSDIAVSLDGDDWYATEHVLTLLNKIYQDPNVWMTHGRLLHYPMNKIVKYKPYPVNVIKKNAFRSQSWRASGLRTFYVWLFKKIKRDDLMWNGDFLPMGWDCAIMYPMFEMAGFRHKFIPDILYIANRANVINDFKVNKKLQMTLSRFIKQKSKYTPLISNKNG